MSWKDFKKKKKEEEETGKKSSTQFKQTVTANKDNSKTYTRNTMNVPKTTTSYDTQKSKADTSLWDQINNIANNTGMRLAKADELKGAKEFTIQYAQDRQKAQKFNKTMKTGSVKDKVEAMTEHFGNAILGGFGSTFGGLGNVATTAGGLVTKGASKVVGLFNEKTGEKLEDRYNDIIDVGRDWNARTHSFNTQNSMIEDSAVKGIGGAVNTVSNVVSNAIFANALGINGTALQASQVAGSSAQESLDENNNKILKATLTGALKGGVSYLTEKMFDANILTKGMKKSSIQELINNTIEKKIGSQVGRNIADKFTGIAGENIEEIVEDGLDGFIDRFINGKELPSWKEWFNETGETVKATTLSTIILNLIGFGGGNAEDIETELKNKNVSQEDIQKAKEFVNIATKEIEDNKVINQQNKIAQNETSQVTDRSQALRQQAQDTLSSLKQFYDENTYNQMAEFIQTAPNEKALNQIIDDLNTESKNRLEETYKSEKFTESKDRKKTYSQYRDEYKANGIQFNNDIVNNALDTVAPNRNGRRTVGQWKQVAEQIGIDAATSDLTKSQIDDIAYGSWFDLQPSKNITQYDNRTKEHKGFEKFTSDDWINTIYESAKGQKIQQLDKVLVNQVRENIQNNGIANTQENTQQTDQTAESNNTKSEETNPYRNTAKANKLIKEKNEKITQLNNALQNVASQEAKESIKKQIKDIEKEYNDKVQKLYDEVKQKASKISDNKNEKTNFEKYKDTMNEVIKGKETKVNELIKNKNNAISEIEEAINKKQKLLDSKKNKATGIANSLRMQIEDLKERKNRIEAEYNRRIDNETKKINKKQNELDTKKQMKLTRKEIKQKLIKAMGITTEDIQTGKDITSLNYQFTDPTRVNEKVFGRELGQKINDVTINKTKHNTAEKTRWLNKERNEIKELGIKARSKESEAVQKYGEKQYVDKNGNVKEYGDKELAKDFQNIETQNKIKKAAEVLRNKYDNYIEQINEVLTSLGYDPIPKRKDYMRHFQELGDVFSQTGIPFNLNDMKAEDLPTDINGLTEFNKPGKNWFAQAQKRYGNKTSYDAITGIDGYLEGAGNLIFHTEDIQNYRALSELIRDTYGQTKGFDNLEGLTDEQVQKRIEDIQSNKLSKYVAWLDEQANSLAGKKGAIDRGVERALGRRAYKVMNTLKSQTGSNMTGFNVRSALTNFISSTIGMAKTNKIAGTRGLVSTINNMFKNDGFIDKSDFLTRRFGSDSLSQKTWQKISNAGQIFMNGTDYFTANLITRSKYFEGIQKGMSEQQAIKYADDFAERVMGDRSQGATAEVFNSKTLGLLTQFQLEVNNQWQYMIHDTKMDFQKNSKEKGYIKAGATAVFQLGQLAGFSWLFNNLFEAITGSRSAFDPIEIIKTLFGVDDDDNDEEKSFDKRMSKATEMLVDNIPLGNIITGGGRIPISDALTGIKTLGKKLTNQKNSYGGEISWKDVGKDTLGSLPYFALPTGYGQIKKTVQGLKTAINDGDYTTNAKGEKQLRFPVENKNVGDYVKGALFGKYALPLSKEYIKNDYKKLSPKQTKLYEESKLPYKELLEYTNQQFKKQEQKINYLSSKDMTEQQKWGIYKYDIFSNTERKDGGSQLKDAEYITSNGVSKKEYMEIYNKAHKNNIDMPTADEYKNLKKKNINLKDYIDYTVKAKNLLQEKKKSGELDENQQLKLKDKCQILLDSNYSDKELKGLYGSYVSKDDTLYSNLNKLTNLDIKAYLKYKQQEIKGDEDKKSIIEGKTESGTKKKNLIEYLNSSNLSGVARLYIYGKQYKYNSSQQKQMRDYIYNSDLSSKEKLDAIKELSKNVEKHKDGKYYWTKPAKK